MGKVFYSGVKLKGTLASGAGDDLLTRDATSKEVGTTTNALGTLNSANIFVGNASNVPTGVAMSGDISIDNAGVTSIATGVIVNADVNASAAIAYSKLSLTGGIVNADINASAAIAYSKLSLTGGIVNADVSATAAIARTKFASGTANRVVVNNASGVMVDHSAITANRAIVSDTTGLPTASATTDTEIGYLSGVTSAVQTQLNSKLQPTITSVAQGDIIYYNGTAWVNLARGTNGQALYSTATSIGWNTPTINGIPIGGSANQYLAKNTATDFDASWVTLTTAKITDITATAAELNIMDGVTATTTEINYIAGVASPIQTQLDGKLSTFLPQNSLFVGNSSNIATALASGTSGYVLTSVSGIPTWAASSAGTPPGSNTQVIFNDAGSFGADAGMTYDKVANTLVTLLRPPAGTAAANTAPIKLTSGSLMTAAEIGSVEFLTDKFYGTITTGTARKELVLADVALTSGRIPFVTTNGRISDDTGFTYDSTNKALTINNLRIHNSNSDNTFVGKFSGNFTLTGIDNTGLGESTLGSTTSGIANVAVGSAALLSVTTSSYNVAVGAQALLNTTGSRNIALGQAAGDNITTGSSNIIIGDAIDAQSATASGQLSIQNIIFGTGNTATGTAISTGAVGIGAVSPDRRLHVELENDAVDVTPALRLTKTRTSTTGFAAGLGTSIEFEVETADTNLEVGATIEAVTTDVTALSEDFDFVFKAMAAGAAVAEVSRISSTGTLTANGLTLGVSGTGGSSRIVQAASSASDASIRVLSKGSSGNVTINDTSSNPGKVGIGTTSPQRKLDVWEEDATTNTVLYPLRITRASTGTPANGIGSGLEFAVETSASNFKSGVILEAVTTDVTGASEDFDFVFKTMAAGAAAAEAVRIKSDKSTTFTGPVVFPSYTVAGVPAAASYTGGMIYVSNEVGGATPAFSDGTNWRRVTDRAIIS